MSRSLTVLDTNLPPNPLGESRYLVEEMIRGHNKTRGQWEKRTRILWWLGKHLSINLHGLAIEDRGKAYRRKTLYHAE